MRRQVLLWPRILVALTVLAISSVVASAYTIVMLDGRRVEIPARFSVSKTTLTYEVSPTIQVTMPVAAINVIATEQANGETAGGFFRHQIADKQSQPEKVQPIQKAQRTITNRELQGYARTRLESEAAYEKRRKELGLPSVEESRRRREAEAALIRQELYEARLGNADSEGYRRPGDSELRDEIGAFDAEITYLRNRLDELAAYSNASSYALVSSVLPLGIGGFGIGEFGIGEFGIDGFGRGGFGRGGFGRGGFFNGRGNFRHFGSRFPRRFAAPPGSSPLLTSRLGFRGGPVRARFGGFGTQGFGTFGFGGRGFGGRGFGRR